MKSLSPFRAIFSLNGERKRHKYVSSAHTQTHTHERYNTGMQVKVYIDWCMKMRQQQQQSKIIPLNWYFNNIFVENKNQFQHELWGRFSLNFLSAKPIWHESAFWKKEKEMWNTVAYAWCAKSTHYHQKWKKKYTFTQTHIALQSEMFACNKLFSKFKS